MSRTTKPVRPLEETQLQPHKIFGLSKELRAKILAIYDDAWTEGTLAEGPYSLGQHPIGFDSTVLHLPVNSGGAGMFLGLQALKQMYNVDQVFIQSNTMRAGYTVPKAAGFDVQVLPSTWRDGLTMDPSAIPTSGPQAVVLVTPIGGYLAPSVLECIQVARDYGHLVMIDAAHAHWLLEGVSYDIAVYSFYSTKVLPLGEGGLVATRDDRLFEWMRRYIQYDKHAYHHPRGVNLRMDEAKARVLDLLITDPDAYAELIVPRIRLAERYALICEQRSIPCIPSHATIRANGILRPKVYNGYKLIVRGTLPLLNYGTGLVFDKLVNGAPLPQDLIHCCPATYNTLNQDEAVEAFEDATA